MALRELLASPVIAGVLGFLVGVALISATAWSRNISTSSAPEDRIAWMMGFMAGALLVAAGVLIAYVYAAPTGFPYFGVSLGAGFVIGLCVFAVIMARES